VTGWGERERGERRKGNQRVGTGRRGREEGGGRFNRKNVSRALGWEEKRSARLQRSKEQSTATRVEGMCREQKKGSERRERRGVELAG